MRRARLGLEVAAAMSLINQVLRDLDQRRADAGPVPTAVRTLPPRRGERRAWRIVVIAIGGLAAVGGAAGMAAWSLLQGPSQAVPHAPAPVAAAVPRASTPVVIVTAPAASAVAAPSPARVERVVALAPVVAASAPAEAASAATETRIEKRIPTRTARERAEAHYQRAVAAHQQGQLGDAAAAYAAALREEPALAAARQALAGLSLAEGRHVEAQSLLSDGVALHPQDAALAMMLARLHAERGELQAAADVLQAAPTFGASADDLAFRAAILQRLNRHGEAAEHFTAALRVTPHNGVWWMGLGMSLAAEGRTDVAREAFNRARGSGSLSPELAQYVEQRLRAL
jgi:MSHA biogenesis protein MshN